jgi:D-alanine-D-alanine ligase
MGDLQILVLGGGSSDEREVSLRSAKAIADAVKQAGFSLKQADPADGLDILNSLEPGTIVFPILHGKGGEDGALQAELERLKIPFLGSGSSSAKDCFDKWQTRQELAKVNIPTASGVLVTKETFPGQELAKKPYVLKVVHGGSSIGTLIARDPGQVSEDQIDQVFKHDDHAVLEELVEGIELTVSILDGQALPVVEIIPPSGEEFDYQNRYNGRTSELCPPANLSEALQQQARAMAEKVHKTMNCRHLSRVDFIARADGSLVVLEINVIPGLTDQSLYPKSAAVAGISMPDLISKFVDAIKRDYSI